MASKDHKQLMKTLNKLSKQEKWLKIPKAKGEVIEKGLTKTGNIKLVIKTKKRDLAFYVLKKNQNLYQTASQIEIGDSVSVALRTHLGRHYCLKLSWKKREKKLSDWL